MQAVLVIPKSSTLQKFADGENILTREVAGMPLLIRVIASAMRAGVDTLLIVWPEDDHRSIWAQCAASPLLRGLEIYHVVRRFDPRQPGCWAGIRETLQDQFYWLPWNWVTHKRALAGLTALSSPPESWDAPALLEKQAILGGPISPFSSGEVEGVLIMSANRIREAERFLVAHSGKPTDGIYSRFNRLLCRPAVRLLSQTPVTPNWVTLGGLVAQLSIGMLASFLVYAAFAALVHELIVGLAAMHSGWFPAFAVALITLVIGMLIGFPPVALALLVGFSAATGPAFADMGYDLKAGYMLRGYGSDPAFERDGRRQQLFAAMFAFVIAGVVVLIAYPGFFAQNLVAPVDRVYVATIKAGASADVAWSLMMWAIPGAVIQFLGGPRRQLGILLATGLLIPFTLAGWAVLVGIVCRVVWERFARAEGMEVFGAGVIAGDALFAFFTSTWKAAMR
jgi:hypothetical protein